MLVSRPRWTLTALAALLGAALLAPTAADAARPRASLAALDVTASTGIGATVNDEDAHGGCTGDLTGEGNRDLFLSRHINDEPQVFLSNGNGTYRLGQTLPVKDPHGCAMWDWEGDGDLDLGIAIGAERGTLTDKANLLFLNDGTGTLTRGPDLDRAPDGASLDGTGRGRTIASGNLDGQAPRDFIIGNAPEVDGQPSNGRAYVREGAAVRDVSGPLATTSLGACALTADWNADGLDDPMLCTGGGFRLWLNEGAPAYREVSRDWGLGYATYAAVGDMNSDGRPDLVTVSNTAIKVFTWQTNRLALAYSRPLTTGVGVAAADVDKDGDLDVYAVTGANDATPRVNRPDVLLLNDGTGTTFTDASGILPQVTEGSGSGVLVLGFYGRTRLLVTNGGGDGAATALGPRQMIEFRVATR